MALSRELAFAPLKEPLPKCWKQIPKEDWQLFAHRVREAGGKVVVAVHAYPEGHIGKKGTPPARLISQARTPVLLLVEQFWMSSASEWLRKGNAPTHLVVPTADGYPYVALSQGFDATHSLLFKKLREAGASTILLAGVETKCHWQGSAEGGRPVVEAEKKWLGSRAKYLTGAVHVGCAGSLYRHMVTSSILEGITVRLVPGAVWPEKPPYFRDVRIRQAFVRNRGLISKIPRKPKQ